MFWHLVLLWRIITIIISLSWTRKGEEDGKDCQGYRITSMLILWLRSRTPQPEKELTNEKNLDRIYKVANSRERVANNSCRLPIPVQRMKAHQIKWAGDWLKPNTKRRFTPHVVRAREHFTAEHIQWCKCTWFQKVTGQIHRRNSIRRY